MPFQISDSQKLWKSKQKHSYYLSSRLVRYSDGQKMNISWILRFYDMTQILDFFVQYSGTLLQLFYLGAIH